MVRIVEQSELHSDKTTLEFEGTKFGGVNVTFLLVEAAPGTGPKLHVHEYDEVFIVQEGQATFTAGDEILHVRAGQIVIVGAGTPHKFVNSGSTVLRQVDIHLSSHFVTRWLEA